MSGESGDDGMDAVLPCLPTLSHVTPFSSFPPLPHVTPCLYHSCISLPFFSHDVASLLSFFTYLICLFFSIDYSLILSSLFLPCFSFIFFFVFLFSYLFCLFFFLLIILSYFPLSFFLVSPLFLFFYLLPLFSPSYRSLHPSVPSSLFVISLPSLNKFPSLFPSLSQLSVLSQVITKTRPRWVQTFEITNIVFKEFPFRYSSLSIYSILKLSFSPLHPSV